MGDLIALMTLETTAFEDGETDGERLRRKREAQKVVKVDKKRIDAY